MKRLIPAGSFLVALGLALGWAAQAPGASEAAYRRLSRALVTPHIPFAHPYAGGPLHALVVAPTGTQRETVELAQRLSLEFVPLMTQGYDRFGPYMPTRERDYAAIAPESFRADVDAKLAADGRYDLIVIGKMKWDAMPEPVRRQILDQVRRGAGLLYVGPWGRLDPALSEALRDDAECSRRILRGLPPLEAMPRWPTATRLPVVRTGRLGAGRAVTLDYGEDEKTVKPADRGQMLESLAPFRSDDPLYYDYWFSLLARAALWAAGREPALRLTGLPARPMELERDRLASTELAVAVEGHAPPDQGYYLHGVIRDRRNRVEHTRLIPWRGQAVSMTLPRLKGGDKVIDVWLRDAEARVVDWASVALTVRPGTAIAGIELDKESFRKGEPVTGTVTVSPALGPGQSVRVDVVDALSRVVASAMVQPGADRRGRFALAVAHPLTIPYTLVAQIVEPGAVVDERTQEFFIDKTDFAELTRDFTLQMWDGPQPNSRSTQTWLRQFARCGIDIVYAANALWGDLAAKTAIARTIARADLMAIPYSTRLYLASTYPGHAHLHPIETPDGPAVRDPNLLALTFEELDRAGRLKGLTDVARAFGPFGPAGYSLGDENALSMNLDICFSDQVRKSFQAYVRGLYPSLEAVNREWATDYKSWDEVKAVTLKRAAEKGRYTPWIDHRLHMDKLFTDLHRACIQAIRAADPDAPVGLEGIVYPTSSFTGFNLYELLPHVQYYFPYNHQFEVNAFWFLPSPSLRGTIFGSYEGASEAMTRYMPWHALFKGANGMFWWHSGLGGSGGLPGLAGFAPDLTPQPLLQAAAEEIAAIKAGLGKLLITADRTAHPIGLYISNASKHASTVRPVETTWEHAIADLHDVLRDAGYQYRYVAPPQVLAGALKEYKALFLPYSQALSAAEAAAMKAFVRDGGLLLADFAPGTMDEHGLPLDRSSLLEVFGEFKRLNIHACGKGRGVYLADYVKGYHTQRKKGLSRGVCDGIARLLTELAGLRPFARVTDDAGHTRQDIEIAQFQAGDAKFLTLLRVFAAEGPAAEAQGPEGQAATGADVRASSRVNVALPAPAHIYDVRRHTYLGQQQAIEADFEPGEARVYAFLPQAATAIRAQSDKAHYLPGEVVTLTGIIEPATLANSGLVARIEVRRGDARLDHYTATVPLKGRFSHTIPLALNEAPGGYSVTVEEIVSGHKARVEFAVRAPGTSP